MIILTINIRVPADEAAALRPYMEAVVKASLAEPGTLAYHYGEDLLTPGLFHVFEMYRDEDAQKAHGQGEAFTKWREVSKAYPREGRTVYDATVKG